METTIYELQKRAKALCEKTQEGSITPEEIGRLHADTLAYIASLEQSADGLGVRKVYKTKAAMEADKAPVGGNGKPLRYGQLVSIYDDAHKESKENGNIYIYRNPGWMLIGNVGDNIALPVVQETGNNATSVMSQAAVTKLLTEYNVSANNSGATYTLQEAINLVPADFRKGGQSITFIDNKTNEYVSYRCISTDWSTNSKQWEKVGDGKAVVKELSQKIPFYKPTFLGNQGSKYIKRDGGITPTAAAWGVASYDISSFNGKALIESSSKSIAYLYAIYKNGAAVEVGGQLTSTYYAETVDCSKGDTLYVQNDNNTVIEPIWKGLYDNLAEYMKEVLGKKNILDLRDVLVGGTNTSKFFYDKNLRQTGLSAFKNADKFACCKVDVSSLQGKTVRLNTFGVLSAAYDSFVDKNGRIISQFQHVLPITILVPDDAQYLYLSTSFGRGEIGETFNYLNGDFPSITADEGGVYNIAEELSQIKNELDKIDKKSRETYDLLTPDLYSYVGDNLQLFKYPISLCANYNAFNMGIALNTTNYNVRKLGKNLERYFQFTPSSDGTYNVLANIVRQDMVVLTQKSFNVTVKTPKNPTSVKNVLLIGDSETEGVLNNSGVKGSESGAFSYANELKRLLQTTTGSPQGVGLTNVRLVGTKNTSNGRHEGYGGWTANSFLSTGSPFYVGGKIDFDAYLQQDKVYDDLSHKGVDFVYILLGANDAIVSAVQNGVLTQDKSAYKMSVKKLLAKIKEQIKDGQGAMTNPNVKVVLLNYGFPYINGFGYHPYGSGEFENGTLVAKSFYECYKINNEIIAEADYKDWVFSTMCGTQVDSENGFVYMNKPLNNYLDETEKVSLEQVHFNRSAYKQFAQAVLRDIIFRVS